MSTLATVTVTEKQAQTLKWCAIQINEELNNLESDQWKDWLTSLRNNAHCASIGKPIKGDKLRLAQQLYKKFSRKTEGFRKWYNAKESAQDGLNDWLVDRHSELLEAERHVLELEWLVDDWSYEKEETTEEDMNGWVW